MFKPHCGQEEKPGKAKKNKTLSIKLGQGNTGKAPGLGPRSNLKKLTNTGYRF